MRISTIQQNNSMMNYITSAESRYYELTEQAASGKKVTRPSDDPAATKSLLNIKTQLSQLDGYLSNMQKSQNELDTLDDQLSSLTDLIGDATDLATEAANGTYSASDLSNIKTQIDTIIQSVVDVANTQYEGKYIFSGTATSTPAYEITRNGTGTITAITYNGTPQTDDYERYVNISDGINVAINISGDQIFGDYELDGTTGLTTANGLLGDLVLLSNSLGNGANRSTTINGYIDGVEHGTIGGTVYDDGVITTSECLNPLTTALDTTSAARTRFAAISGRFDITTTSIESTVTSLTAYQSDLEDCDLATVLADLAAQETALQATMSVTSSLLAGTSLLDYL